MEDFKWDWTTKASKSTKGSNPNTTNDYGPLPERNFALEDNNDKKGSDHFSGSVPPVHATCPCEPCKQDAQTLMENKFSDEKQANDRIAKLEGLVKHLQESTKAYAYRLGLPAPGQLKREDSSSSLSSIGSAVSVDTVAQKEAEAPRDIEGPKIEIKRSKKIHPDYGDPVIKKDRETGVIGSAPKNLNDEYVLTVFREFDKSGNFWRRYVEILSPAFIEVLRKISPYDIDLPVASDVLSVAEPLKILFHHRKHLVKYLEEGNDDVNDSAVTLARSHTKLILDFMQKEWDSVNQTLNDIESDKPSGLITFPDIWLLYAPGTIVFTKENGEYEAFVVDSIRGNSKRQTRTGHHNYSKLELTCWSINYDGEVFGRVWSSHWIAPFHGSKDISSLGLIPEKFLPNVSDVKQFMISRGKSFWALQGQNYRDYTGEVWSQHMTEDSVRVMVDHLTYQKRNNWPIIINRKKGPSAAVSKNWKENKFRIRTNEYGAQIDNWGRPIPPPPPMAQYYEDDERDHNPNRWDMGEDNFTQPYWTYACERPFVRVDSRFNKYDVLQPDQELDDLMVLLCPQRVHGYCLRDRIWSKLTHFPLT